MNLRSCELSFRKSGEMRVFLGPEFRRAAWAEGRIVGVMLSLGRE